MHNDRIMICSMRLLLESSRRVLAVFDQLLQVLVELYPNFGLVEPQVMLNHLCGEQNVGRSIPLGYTVDDTPCRLEGVLEASYYASLIDHLLPVIPFQLFLPTNSDVLYDLAPPDTSSIIVEKFD